MNEPDFEQRLRSIEPAKPRRSLEEKIARDLAPARVTAPLPETRMSWLDRLFGALGWTAAGAAAGIVAMLLVDIGRQRGAASEQPASVAVAEEPDIELEHQLLEVADDGIVQDEEDGLARVVRYESLERRRWTDQTGAVTVVEVPREDLVLIPVSFQ